MMIAAVCKVQCGVEKLCQRGRSNGRRDYESSSMCAGHNYFKVFVPEAPCCFGGKSGGVLMSKLNHGMNFFLTQENSMKEEEG